MEKLLTIAEVAQLLAIGQGALRRMVEEKLVQHVRAGTGQGLVSQLEQ
jgi:excisionase family DNA binding protein